MLDEKLVILITGSTRGLGKSLALHYLAKGHIVAGCSRGTTTINSENYQHTTLDLSEESAVRSWISQTRRKHKRIDVLICNASLVQSTLFLSLTSKDLIESFLKTNILGTFYPLREVSKYMTQQKFGRIIVISSTMEALKEKGTSVYSSTKSFVTQMTKVLAKELGPTGVTCNMIAPGMMWTSSSEELANDEKWYKHMLDLQTIPRVIRNEEVSHVADFYISPHAAAVTGQVIYLGIAD